jgi:single-strand DNA-binding protein
MARGFSKVIIMGNLTRDPELRSTPSGTQVCSFSVAVNRVYNGNEQVSYFDCSAWGKMGETVAQYCKRGSGILVSGRLDQRSYEDKDGNKRSRVEITVEDFNFVGGNGDGGAAEGGSSSRSRSSKKTSAPADEVAPDDMSD